MKYVFIFIVLLLAVLIVYELYDRRGESLQRDEKSIESQISIPSLKIKKMEEYEGSITVSEASEANLTLLPPQLSVAERLSILDVQIGDPIFIRIFKYTAELEIWIKVKEQYKLLQTYEICRQSGYLGPKLKEGDKQGPEGFYYVTKSRLNPNSKFHLSFNLGYPNTYDRAHKRTGSALMVHGNCVSIGCFAMTDEKIEEIYELVEKALEDGQRVVRVHIFPFRMTDAKMDRYRSNQWYDFWLNLKEGYDYFEENGTPPNVEVEKRRYVFTKPR